MNLRLVLFGPFAVTGPDAPAEVRGAIPQAILARLGLEPGRTFTTDELVAALWPEPSATLVSSLRAHISRLRARGWGNVLSGGRAGYRLDLPEDAVDIAQFRALLRVSGDARMSALERAEGLWRGAPLAAASGFPFAAPVVDQLTELRRTAGVELAQDRLDRGRATAAVTGLAPLARDLTDAQVGALYAQALDRSGRTADALAAIDERVAALRDAGLPPSAELSALRLTIARQDDAPGDADAPAPIDRIGFPAPVTRFIGREAELEAVRRGRAQSRLVTLTGPAGVGKTRLAVELARRAGGEDDDSQWLVDLAVVASPDRVVGAVAEAVGTDHSLDAVAAALGGRRTLLVLDNAEHVLGAVATVCAGLLERCEGLNVVVTSRESMRMAGERVIAVEPLVGASLADAVDLFLLRASESSGITEWSEAQVTAARRLCAQLDGLPLAIELAASRLDVLTLDELTASLSEPADAGNGTASVRRHDSIDAAIDWSIRTTSVAERALLSQLVEFSGSFSLEAVAGICAADGSDPREITVSLARRSLVSAVGSSLGERRFRMLDIVKRYVKATHPIPDRPAWQRRHAAWMTEYAERMGPLLRTPDSRRARQALAANRADLDAATMRAIGWGDRSLALRLVAALAWFWYERGSGHETIATIERVLDLPGEPMPHAEAAALYPLVFLRSISGDVVAVVHAIQRFAEVADEAADPAYAMIAHTLLASLAAYEGGADAAAVELEVARAHRARVGEDSRWAIADHLYIRGDAFRIAGLPAQALDSLEEAYRMAGEVGHTRTLAATCYITGKVLTEVGRARDALGMLRTGAQRSAEREDGTSTVAALSAFAVALVELGEHRRAAELFGIVDAQGPRFGFHPIASDGSYAAPFRERAAHELGDGAWRDALERGRGRDLRWAITQIL